MKSLWLWGLLAAGWALGPGARADDRLGRLFFTPEQRAALARPSPQAPGGPATAVHINGVVRPRAGPGTVWINGVAQRPAPAPSPERNRGQPKAP